jgi:hypothetical protein
MGRRGEEPLRGIPLLVGRRGLALMDKGGVHTNPR